MTDEQQKEVKRQEEIQARLSVFIRARLLAVELGVKIVAMDFTSGRALLKFEREDAATVAALA